jgi:hypothetical protein
LSVSVSVSVGVSVGGHHAGVRVSNMLDSGATKYRPEVWWNIPTTLS